ncbi:hypothetical protein, partial [Anaerotruncus colihominis]|uniref:hypothetical protein n=1 Tax=Anaerotruncus colihominis TaxID=169435 RepID=UPI001A9A7067
SLRWAQACFLYSAFRPTGANCMSVAPALLFAAQPVKAQLLSHCSRRSRLKFFAKLFLKKRAAY